MEQGIKRDLDNPLKLGIGSGIVGSEEFITELKQMLGIQGEPAREQPETRQLHRAFTADELIDRFSKVVAVEKEALLARADKGDGSIY